MIENLLNDIIYQTNYLQLFLWVTGYFVFLYFVLGPIFLFSCQYLYKKGLLQQIQNTSISRQQLLFEIKHSTKSIVIFGLSVVPIIYLIRTATITLAENNWGTVLFGLVLLTVWNEIHFFIVHRIMHLPFFMRNVHYIHHQSKTPTVFSVYSFHWLEAALLSTVPLTILPFISLSPTAIFLFPLVSILLNYAGHCNYRFGNGSHPNWAIFGTKHFNHHHKFSNSYGFASGLMDKLYKKIKPKTNQPNP